MVSQHDRDECNRTIEAYSEKANKIRDLSTDEDMERYRKRLARTDKIYRGQIGIGLSFLTVVMLILGVADVFTDQILHASISAISAGIFLVTAVMAFRLPRISSVTVYLAMALGFLFQTIRLALRGSWWSAATEIFVLVIILFAWHRSRKLTQRK